MTTGIYKGDWKDGMRHGGGNMKYVNGDVYKGHWKAGKIDGPGKLTHKNREVCNGDRKDDKRRIEGDEQGICKHTHVVYDSSNNKWKGQDADGSGNSIMRVGHSVFGSKNRTLDEKALLTRIDNRADRGINTAHQNTSDSSKSADEVSHQLKSGLQIPGASLAQAAVVSEQQTRSSAALFKDVQLMVTDAMNGLHCHMDSLLEFFKESRKMNENQTRLLKYTEIRKNRMPLTFLIEPVPPKTKSATCILWEDKRLMFICPVTLKEVSEGRSE